MEITKILGYLIWFLIAIICIYVGTFVRYKFFNRQRRDFKSVSNDYFYYNYIIGILIFLILFFITKYLLGFDIIKDN